jgi:hypothetical protein
VGSTINLAGAGYASDVQTGLNDNVRRQGLPNDGSGVPAYILVTVPVCNPCTNPITVVGFATFNLAASQIGLTHLSGTFVPYVNDPSSSSQQTPGVSWPLWGPNVVALTQ